ncbi:MAG: tRNA (adenosine(37)-N6)-threonylcarbamoyltransferase complex dimerization subunit type 1 TsaB [Candidatus Acidiferrales bacterium]
MWLLAVDTSGRAASMALRRDGRLVASVTPEGAEQHSVALFGCLRRGLDEIGINLAAIDVYAVANGPGAFTALRVGLSVVKALAEMHQKPVVVVSVLEAVCQAAAADGLLVPLVDAYRGQIFAGLYEKNSSDLLARGPERVMTMEEYLAELAAEGVRPAECTLVGPQVERWLPRLGEFAAARRESISPLLAEAVARRAEGKLARGDTVDALRVQANYVRRSDAELLWKEK